MKEFSMDMPQPPPDTELRNIIDKLAQFVARNGPEFEQMTKQKQQGNPKFQFLYGGEYYAYYQYKVQSEHGVLSKQQGYTSVWQNPPSVVQEQQQQHAMQTLQQAMQQQREQQQQQSQQQIMQNCNPPPPQSTWQPPPQAAKQPQSGSMSLSGGPPVTQSGPDIAREISDLTQQIETLHEQIKQSEQNLQAQHTVLLQQQQVQAEALVADNEIAQVQRDSEEFDVPLAEFRQLLQPIVEHQRCTKDKIQAGKSWILTHATSKEKANCIANMLLCKMLQDAPLFTPRLHIIYLVNDVLHHCARKNVADIKDAFEEVVIPMFCSASVSADSEEQRTKLNKLLDLWKSKSIDLDENTIDAMRRPAESLQLYKQAQIAKYQDEVSVASQPSQTTFENYRSQHQAFVAHATQQIREFEQRKVTAIEEQVRNAAAVAAALVAQSQQQQQQQQHHVQQQQPAVSIASGPLQHKQQDPHDSNSTSNHSIPPLQPPPMMPNIPPPQLQHFNQPPPNFFPPPGVFPDFSKPPPWMCGGGAQPNGPQPQIGNMAGGPNVPVAMGTQMQMQQQAEELLPRGPYYELPAGLMVPLIKLEDTKFHPINPADVRLPAPAPPTERLLAAVDAFYMPPSHERPRDSEGWEKLGLFEYYKAKNVAKKEKMEQIAAGLREASRSPSPIILIQEKSPSPPRRRYQSPPPSRDYSSSKRRSRSRSNSRSPTRSASSGGVGAPGGGGGGSSRRRDRDRGGDRESRESRRSARRNSRRSRSPSRSRSRSPPPSMAFGGTGAAMPGAGSAALAQSRLAAETIDASNKGHQMLKRMGWGGSGGLGAQEQGIDAPISGGDVRDKQDQFKGVGCMLNDPFENFRKNKGAAFITRMKARAEERSQEGGTVGGERPLGATTTTEPSESPPMPPPATPTH